MPDHLPLEAWERSELLSKLWNAKQIQKNMEKELERRGQRDEWKWAYEVPVHGKTERGATYLTSGYMLFESAAEAYSKVPDIARQYERDPETAPYHVIKVWLPKDYPASVDRSPEGEKPQALNAKHESAVPERQTPQPHPKGQTRSNKSRPVT